MQYRTAGDEKVRESHQTLHGVTLPKDDPFWDEYYPPLGWRCRCVAVEVLARKSKKSDSAAAIKKAKKATTQIGKNGKNKLEMFRFNPGQNKKLMPPKNSYVPKNCKGISKLSNAIVLGLEDEACRAQALIEKEALKRERKELKQWAKKNIQGKSFKIGNEKVRVTGACIDELINQPHKHFSHKNKAILDLSALCKKAKGKPLISTHTKGKKGIAKYHLYEVEINNEPSWINIRFVEGADIGQLYTITDSIKKRK